MLKLVFVHTLFTVTYCTQSSPLVTQLHVRKQISSRGPSISSSMPCHTEASQEIRLPLQMLHSPRSVGDCSNPRMKRCSWIDWHGFVWNDRKSERTWTNIPRPDLLDRTALEIVRLARFGSSNDEYKDGVDKFVVTILGFSNSEPRWEKIWILRVGNIINICRENMDPSSEKNN